VNKEHIKRWPLEKQKDLLFEQIKNEPWMVGEPELDPEQIPWRKSTKGDAVRHLEAVRGILEKGEMGEKGREIMGYAEREGKGDVLWPVRYALTGAIASPDPITLLEFLGKEKSLKRLQNAIIALRNAS